MTSEVVILNSQGIALAADSAVTIGTKKTYNSAIKLFSLSKYAPIGVMVYGKADLLGVPWELLIKCYRRKLGNRIFPKVGNYVDDFLNFLEHCNYCSDEVQSSWVENCATCYFYNIREELFESIHEHVKQNGEISILATEQIAKTIILSHYTDLKELGYAPKYDEPRERQHNVTFNPRYRAIISETFEKLPLSENIIEILCELATFLISRDIHNNNDISGIVIAGYGESQVFPSAITHEISGLANGCLKYRLAEDKSYKREIDGDAAIIPFADAQMIKTFMSGISPNMNDFLVDYLSVVFQKLPQLIEECFEIKDATSNEKLSNGLLKINDNILRALLLQQKNEHVDTVMSMVSALPKDELAAMAESLVSLTAFKRKMSSSIESVGGPVDVLVISKGDGLVWVKRKHYFPPQLNHSFFENYHGDNHE